MEQFTDNYFMDVQRINFWQSEFNDTSSVDNNISNISDTIFKELCAERRKFIIDFLSKRNETDKFLRNNLNMKNVINLSYNTIEHQYVYEMKFCRNVNVVEKFLMMVMKKIPATQEFQWLQKIRK
uniref:Uncharacterized protein n=1 Tax=Strongyloides venezuelensis TaxID=75913 RepID=A0A0K0FPF6_STRVS